MEQTFIGEGFTERVIWDLQDCMNPIVKSYSRNEIIMRFSQDIDDIGIISSGIVYLTSVNVDGQKSIIDYYEKNDIFGKRFSPDADINGYYIMAKTKCEIIFVKYEKLISCCHNCCKKHAGLIDYLIRATVCRAQVHIDILSQRTIRAKLMYYFKYISGQKGTIQFKIPLSLSDLADYLSVDRSAMMREIRNLNNQRIISSKGGKILLLQNDK